MLPTPFIGHTTPHLFVSGLFRRYYFAHRYFLLHKISLWYAWRRFRLCMTFIIFAFFAILPGFLSRGYFSLLLRYRALRCLITGPARWPARTTLPRDSYFSSLLASSCQTIKFVNVSFYFDYHGQYCVVITIISWQQIRYWRILAPAFDSGLSVHSYWQMLAAAQVIRCRLFAFSLLFRWR